MKGIIFVLIFFLAISAVSAGENQTFTDLQNIIEQTQPDDIINLTSDYSYGDGDHEITISHSLTINGNNHVLDGKSKTKIMDVMAENVIINNITFINGNNNEGSGAIEAYDATVTNCIFINNHGQSGGAVSSYGGNINHCTFINNSAEYDGGALFLTESTMENCHFDNNRATNGGAVLSTQSTIFDCLFTNNHADLDGGAVYLYIGSVEKSAFINNTAGLTGGALHLILGKAKDCYFENNSAEDYGGAIYNDRGEIENCTFKNNSAWKGNNVFNHPYYNDEDDDIDIEPYHPDSNRSLKQEKDYYKASDSSSTGNPIALLLAGLVLPISRRFTK